MFVIYPYICIADMLFDFIDLKLIILHYVHRLSSCHSVCCDTCKHHVAFLCICVLICEALCNFHRFRTI